MFIKKVLDVLEEESCFGPRGAAAAPAEERKTRLGGGSPGPKKLFVPPLPGKMDSGGGQSPPHCCCAHLPLSQRGSRQLRGCLNPPAGRTSGRTNGPRTISLDGQNLPRVCSNLRLLPEVGRCSPVLSCPPTPSATPKQQCHAVPAMKTSAEAALSKLQAKPRT